VNDVETDRVADGSDCCRFLHSPREEIEVHDVMQCNVVGSVMCVACSLLGDWVRSFGTQHGVFVELVARRCVGCVSDCVVVF
jgi:hypothetical protein